MTPPTLSRPVLPRTASLPVACSKKACALFSFSQRPKPVAKASATGTATRYSTSNTPSMALCWTNLLPRYCATSNNADYLKIRWLFGARLVACLFQKGASGRDHNPRDLLHGLPAPVLSGAIPMATDAFGWKAEKDVATVYGFHATILHLLGLNHKRLLTITMASNAD